MSPESLHSTNKAKMEIRSPPEPWHLWADILPHSPRTRRRSPFHLLFARIIIVLFNCAVARAPPVISLLFIALVNLPVRLLVVVVAVFWPLPRRTASWIGEEVVNSTPTPSHPSKGMLLWKGGEIQSQSNSFSLNGFIREDYLFFGGEKALFIPSYLTPWKAYSLPQNGKQRKLQTERERGRGIFAEMGGRNVRQTEP